MIKAEILDALVASGCTPEQIAAAVKASMGKGSGAARQAAYRARLKEREAGECDDSVTPVTQRDVTERNVTNDVTDGFSLSPVPLLPPIPPNNPLTPKPTSKNNKRGHRLPEDWTMSGPDLAYALSKNLSEREAVDLFERFCSWAWAASGPNALKVNWHQAWQGWVQRDGPKIIASRRGPAGKLLSEFQRKQAETNDVRSLLRDVAAGGRGGGTTNRLLPFDHGERREGVCGGDGESVGALPRAFGGRGD